MSSSLSFLRPERSTVTVHKLEVLAEEDKPEEKKKNLVRVLKGISQQLSVLAKGKFAARMPKQGGSRATSAHPGSNPRGPGPESAPSMFVRGPLMGSCFHCGRYGHTQRFCQAPPWQNLHIGHTALKEPCLPKHQIDLREKSLRGWGQHPLFVAWETDNSQA